MKYYCPGLIIEYCIPTLPNLTNVPLLLTQLSANACAALVPCFPDYFSSEAIDTLLPLCLDPVLEVRHGALMGISELLPALKAAGLEITAERIAQVRCSADS